MAIYTTANDAHLTLLDNLTHCIKSTTGNDAEFRNNVVVDGILSNTSNSLIPTNANEYVTKFYV